MLKFLENLFLASGIPGADLGFLVFPVVTPATARFSRFTRN